jgi:hypothetical protein
MNIDRTKKAHDRRKRLCADVRTKDLGIAPTRAFKEVSFTRSTLIGLNLPK